MSTDLHARLDQPEAQLRRQQRISRLCLGLVLLTAAGAWWTTKATRDTRAVLEATRLVLRDSAGKERGVWEVEAQINASSQLNPDPLGCRETVNT